MKKKEEGLRAEGLSELSELEWGDPFLGVRNRAFVVNSIKQLI